MLREAAGRVFPGGVLHVSVAGETCWCEAAGVTALAGTSGDVTAVEADTVFDLASLTKPLATAACIASLAGEGRLGLDDALGRWLPWLAGTGKDGLRVRTVMAHCAGLPAWRPYGAEVVARLGEAAAGTREAVAEVASRVAAEPLEYPPGTACVYSDLGYILLGAVVEAAAGCPLDAAFADRVAGPLRLRHAFFARAGETPPVPSSEIAATELCALRHRVLRGEVHDENAFALGGVAGHAGLFATASDVGAIAAAFHAAWLGRPDGPFAPWVVRAFWSATPLPGSTRIPGFDTPSASGSSAGERHPPRLVGHLGFTGTSFWLDVDACTVVTLLTNRVHPTRANEAIRAFRPAIHDAVWDAVRQSPH